MKFVWQTLLRHHRLSVPRAVALGAATLGLVMLTGSMPANATTPKYTTLTPIAFDYNGASTTYLPLYVAQQRGYFAREGISMTFQTLTSTLSGPLVASSGATPISTTGGSSAGTLAVQDGSLLKNVVVYVNDDPLVLVGGHGITSVSQLVGKTVFADNPTGFIEETEKIIFGKNNLTPGSVNILGGQRGDASAVAVLISGQVSGVLINISTYLADHLQQAGYQEIANGQGVTKANAGGVVVPTALITQDPGFVKRYVTAILMGTEFVYKNELKSLGYIEQYLNLSKTNAAKVWREAEPIWVPSGNPGKATLTACMNSYAYDLGHSTASPSSLAFDLSLLPKKLPKL